MRSAYPVSGQRLCLAKSLQVSPEVQGRGQTHRWDASTASRPRPPGGQGQRQAWGVERAPRLLGQLSVPPQPGPTHSGAGELPASPRPRLPPHPPTPAGEEPAIPQGIGAGTNGSADYRCLLIKEPNPFVFPAPILGSLEVQRARSWPGERYQGRDCFSSGHWGWRKFGF